MQRVDGRWVLRSVVWILVVLGAAVVAPRAAMAANTCNAFLSIDYPVGPDFAKVGDIYRVGLDLGTGSINGGTTMQINRVRFELDCSTAGTLGIPCTDDGTLIEYQGDGTITTTCPSITFLTGHGVSTNPNEVVFTPNTPILIAANTPNFCRIEFDVKVLSITDPDPTPTRIEEVAGFDAMTFDATCNNGLQSSGSQSGSINLCPACVDNDCNTAACNQVTGMCDFTPKPDSTPCTDTDSDPCTTAACVAGVCDQNHTVCTTTTTTTSSTTSSTTTSTSSTTSTTLGCVPVPEDCTNMIDDDCDTLVDCLDRDDCPPSGNPDDPCPIAKKDPTDIHFEQRPALDRLRSKAVLEGLPADLDLSTVTIGMLLTKPGVPLYQFEMSGAALQSNSRNTTFDFRDRGARTSPTGGMYHLKLKKQKDGTSYTISTVSFADLSAATDPQMHLQFYIGDTVFITIDSPWRPLVGGKGWKSPKDH